VTLQSSGQISLNDIHVEGGGSTGTLASINESQIRDLIFKGSGSQMSFSEWYGASKANGLFALQEIRVSDYISGGGTFTIPSGGWLWSDDTTTAALTINIPCTVVNNGYIIGKGGAGSSGSPASGFNGGPAISVTSTGVTITNSSGAYIAGGGGGGAAAIEISTGNISGGGGGAGGGTGGSGEFGAGQPGGGIDQNGTGSGATNAGAGGAGGGSGGGRKLPGSGGQYVSPFASPTPNIGFGGSAGNAGGAGGVSSSTSSGSTVNFNTGGAGGGWGASGGSVPSGNGLSAATAGSGGAAITGTSITLNNNGTIYGST